MSALLAFFRSLRGHARGTAVPGEGRPGAAGAADLAGPPRRTVSANGFRVELDLGSQVLAIDAPVDETWEGSTSREPRLAATLGRLELKGPVSAAVLAQKAKLFDDGLYAAVEVAAQEGAGSHAGKAALLASLAGALARTTPDMAGGAGAVLLAGARLGEVAVPDLPAPFEARVQGAVREFLADDLRSKPTAFYTWSGRLASIFQQDRMLQTELRSAGELDPKVREGIETLVSVLASDPGAREMYDRHLRLVSRLTNPFARPDLRYLLEAPDRGSAREPLVGTAFFPPSKGHETEIVRRMFGNVPVPEGFVLADEMIRRVRSGGLDLTPCPESGWYDHQTWALEPLIVPERMPEGARLALRPGYRKLLDELFKGLLTLTRETHVKQLELGMALGSPWGGLEPSIFIAPDVAAEPLPTFYLRRGLGYRFVRGALEEAFGPAALGRMQRLTPAGKASASLAEDLIDIEQLFIGAHVTVARQLGMDPDATAGDPTTLVAAASRFEAWSRRQAQDSDLGEDMRAMVPVFFDLQRNKTKVWAFLGWSQRPVTVSFARPPAATVLDRWGRPARAHPRITWGWLCARLAYPVMAELYVERLLNRAEFRQLCDSCGTRAEIMRRLGAPVAGRAEHDEESYARDPTCTCAQCGWQPPLSPGCARLESCPRCGGCMVMVRE